LLPYIFYFFALFIYYYLLWLSFLYFFCCTFTCFALANNVKIFWNKIFEIFEVQELYFWNLNTWKMC
jgi:hypothetical protein